MNDKERAAVFAAVKRDIINGDADAAARTVQGAIDAVVPLELVDQAMMPGMKSVGEQFSAAEIFLPELLLATEAFERVMKIIRPRLLAAGTPVATRGRVVIGTVQTDIHELGKNIVGTLLSTAGFEVFDLGASVPAYKFVDKALEVDADLIALSAIMTTTMTYQKDLIELLTAQGLRDRYKVMVGGGVVTRQWANEIGADGYGEVANDAVDEALRLVAEHRGA